MPRLTKRTLDAIKPDPNRETFVWCSGLAGFGARIYPSGRINFIAQVRVNRAQRRVKIGAYGPFTVEQARERAEEVIRAASEGRDPQQEKQDRKEALTVAELCDLYMEASRAGLVLTRFRRPKKASTILNDDGRIERHIKPLLGSRIARDLRASDVQRMADDIAKGKTAVTIKNGKPRAKAVVKGGAIAAGRVVELLGGIWTWGAKRELIPADVSITRHVDTTKGDPRGRMLSPGELKSLGEAIRAAEAGNPMAADAARLIAMTGSRRQEVVSLTWPEVDEAGSCMHLGDTKTGRSTRALGAPALTILSRLAEHKRNKLYVFPNYRGDGPADLKKGIAAIFDAAGLDDARSHVLRRTFGSIGDELGFSEATVGALLGHTARGVTSRHYIRRPDAALVAAANRIAEQIELAMSDAPGAEVVSLPGAKRG